jgi:hypothetical protein
MAKPQLVSIAIELAIGRFSPAKNFRLKNLAAQVVIPMLTKT